MTIKSPHCQNHLVMRTFSDLILNTERLINPISPKLLFFKKKTSILLHIFRRIPLHNPSGKKRFHSRKSFYIPPAAAPPYISFHGSAGQPSQHPPPDHQYLQIPSILLQRRAPGDSGSSLPDSICPARPPGWTLPDSPGSGSGFQTESRGKSFPHCHRS